VWLDNGDTLRGTMVEWDEQRATVRTDADDTEIPIDRISTILFRARTFAKPQRQGITCRLGLRDGSAISVTRVTLANGRLDATTLDGVRLSSDRHIDAKREVISLQTIQGGVTYLSDLKPLGYRHTPYLTLSWPLGVDRNARGGQLRSRGVVYDKGLGMPSTSRVVYRLDSQYRRLDAQLAIDDRAGQGGSVVFRVYLEEGQGPWRSVYQSPVVRGGGEPLPMSVDVHGARHVALVVDHADRAGQLDWANWLDVRVVK
jgi:hypothetical protein